jgi:WD40 repeat protein
VAGEKSHNDDPMAQARVVAASLSLQGRFIASCQANGENHIWDLGQRKMVGEITENRGPGLALRRIHHCNTRFFYQTRESTGAVSLHDASNASFSVITSVETGSQTFCTASPCVGNTNLVALPSSESSFAVVRDWRMSPSNHPIARFHGANGIKLDHLTADDTRKHGMITSLAMIESTDATVIICGMESGMLFLHDLAMLRQPLAVVKPCNIQTSSTHDPILSLDVASSRVPSSFVVVTGMAGNSEEVALLPKPEQGRVAIIKASIRNGDLQARLRNRLETCTVGGAVSDGKPGVALCRFRPDGRYFAVGGWDKRLRIFDRSISAKTTTPLAILRGHVDSVNAMDWSPDAASSGLLATGSSDGRVYIWKCFSSTAES